MSRAQKNKRWKLPKSFLIYALGFYVLVQFVWWAYMLVNLNAEIYTLKHESLVFSELAAPEQLIQKAQLDQKLTLRIWMVLGEGAVFVLILILGFWAVRKSIAKELDMAQQQKNFLLSVTHELKSPLAAIKLQLQTLQSRVLQEPQKKQLYQRALADADRLENLVENLLLVNKVESGGLPLHKEQINLSEFLQQQLETSYPAQLEEGKMILRIQQDVVVHVDKMAFQSICINLIDNAIKYGGPGKITISLAALAATTVEFAVADTGEGIPPHEKKKVLERFYRIGSENVRQTKGTGIGLYLVRLLVDAHAGSMAILDNQPTGTRMVVQLPTGG